MRERQNASREEQRERETQNLKQAIASELSAQSPTWGSNSELQGHDLSQSQTLNQLSHQVPPKGPALNTITLALGFATYELWRDINIQTIAESKIWKCLNSVIAFRSLIKS